MCTCFTFKNGDFYFGRNMDLEYTFGEKIVITPRNYPFAFRREKPYKSHYAILGMATADSGYPLYAEAVNALIFQATPFIRSRKKKKQQRESLPLN